MFSYAILCYFCSLPQLSEALFVGLRMFSKVIVGCFLRLSNLFVGFQMFSNVLPVAFLRLSEAIFVGVPKLSEVLFVGFPKSSDIFL